MNTKMSSKQLQVLLFIGVVLALALAYYIAEPNTAPVVVTEEVPAELPAGTNETTLVSTDWVWEYTEGDTLVSPTRIEAPADETFVLSFEGDRFTSSTDCNQLAGGYIKNDEVLSLGPIMSTKMACIEETLESTYSAELSRVTSHTIVDGELRLILEKDTGVMVFSKKTAVLPEEEMVFCTQDAMECPDGSFVGRTGPACEFAACPQN